ncbi:MAG: hypothetical protein ACRETX_15885 [Steroidobacteraceae bacterium]
MAALTVPTPVLVVLAGVAAFLILAMLDLWMGVLVIAAACLALGLYGMVRS